MGLRQLVRDQGDASDTKGRRFASGTYRVAAYTLDSALLQHRAELLGSNPNAPDILAARLDRLQGVLAAVTVTFHPSGVVEGHPHLPWTANDQYGYWRLMDGGHRIDVVDAEGAAAPVTVQVECGRVRVEQYGILWNCWPVKEYIFEPDG